MKGRADDAGPSDPVCDASPLVDGVLALLENAGTPAQLNDAVVKLIEEWEHSLEPTSADEAAALAQEYLDNTTPDSELSEGEREDQPEEVQKHKAMDAYFAVFNCHVNNARARARRAFIAKYGRPAYMKVIYPYWRRGIMSIFHDKPTEHTKFFVDKITEFVNEGREP